MSLDHDFDPEEAAAWEEFQASLDALHYPGAKPPTILIVPEPEPFVGGLVNWEQLLNGERVEQEWLVEPFLARGRAHALYAPAKAGKSLLALEVACAAAAGRPVLGQPAGPPRIVMYVDLEMTEDDLRERVEDLGYAAANLALLHYYLLPSLPPLDTPAGGAAVVAEATRIGAQLVVVDTVARAISGPENDADTIRDLARYTFTPLKRHGITSLRVDHSGKDLGKGQRGTSAKNDDVDVVWQLTAGDASSLTVKATFRRLAWVPEEIILTRVDDPLRHLTGAPSWPAGTLAAARGLDAAGASLDISIRAARAIVGGRTAIVAAAVKYRRLGPESVTQSPGNIRPPNNGERSEVTSGNNPSDQGVTPGVTSGNIPSGVRVTEYPPLGGTGTRPLRKDQFGRPAIGSAYQPPDPLEDF